MIGGPSQWVPHPHAEADYSPEWLEALVAGTTAGKLINTVEFGPKLHCRPGQDDFTISLRHHIALHRKPPSPCHRTKIHNTYRVQPSRNTLICWPLRPVA